MKYLKPIFISCALLVLAASCRFGPTYQRNEKFKQESFRFSAEQSASIADTPWWDLFKDSVLTALIDSALNNNLNLEASVSRIRQAEAQLGVVRANLFPRVNYAASGSYSFSTEENQSAITGVIPISYQVDLWGRFKNLNDAAYYDYLATEEAYKNITINLISTIANAYFLLRDLDNRLLIAENTAKSWEDNLEINLARNKAGLISEVAVNQAIIQVEEAKTSIQTFHRLRVQTENSISILLGKPPMNIPRGLPIFEQVLPPQPPTGIPSSLLDRRPDLLVAERNLQAQHFRVGATEALQYPSLTLTADLGASFLNPAVAFADLGAQIFGPIFNSQENKKLYEIELEITEQLFLSYQNTFINAIREVEDGLVAVETYNNELASRIKQVEASNSALNLAWVRYDNGVTSYLEILDLQRSAFNSELKASETMQLKLSSIVNLYVALGGGWQFDENINQ